MSKRRSRKTATVVAQAIDLSLAVPQVVAHRVTRMALAGAQPSARDRREFERMGTEKIAALQESWSAMGAEWWRANQRLTATLLRSFWFPWTGAWIHAVSRQTDGIATDLLAAGMAPLRRRAVANAKRLAATPLGGASFRRAR